MSYIKQRITIIQTRKPARTSLNEELQWLGDSLGLFNLRDKDKSCFRLFIELLKVSKQGMPVSSDELGEKLNLSRGTVIHHISRLMESGLVVHEGRRYMLRDGRLELVIDDIRRDFERTVEELKKAAKEIDEMLEM